MKKVLALICVCCSILWLLSGCRRGSTQVTANETTIPNVEITFFPPHIELDSYVSTGYFIKEEMRYAYLVGFWAVYDLFTPYAAERWHDEHYNKPEEVTEMMLVTLIKADNVPKEKFEEAIRKEAEDRISRGLDLSSEACELPNADIIYTFDNEIINAYYRRENPVVPEKYKTYESYEEYLKANPE